MGESALPQILGCEMGSTASRNRLAWQGCDVAVKSKYMNNMLSSTSTYKLVLLYPKRPGRRASNCFAERSLSWQRSAGLTANQQLYYRTFSPHQNRTVREAQGRLIAHTQGLLTSNSSLCPPKLKQRTHNHGRKTFAIRTPSCRSESSVPSGQL